MVALRGDHLLKLNYMEKSRGLGDTVAKFTKATGIKKVVNTVNKVNELRGIRDCGCNKRKNRLNKKFPYKK